jgi:two-component system sensor kinase FixL
VSVAAAPTGGEPLLVAFVRDLAAPRAARSLESRLSEAGRFSLLAEMAAGTAHEINQPLSAIATYAQAARRILEREKPSARTLAEICTKIEDQALRAGGVLENLRKFVRRQEIRKEVLDVNRLVGDVLGVIEAEALVAGIAVTARLAETVPPVRANALQLQQVLLDVARNAIDAMRQEPQHDLGISIATSATDGGGASIAVTDHGPGVSRQLGDNIFHPFVTTKRDALGVGLAVGRTIVQCYGGSLTYHDNPAGGAVFVIELPPVEGAENGSAQPDGNDEQRRPVGLSR